MARGTPHRCYRDQGQQITRKGMGPKALKFMEQRRRADELDTIRLQRRLTDAEAAEADRLAHCYYLRLRRQMLHERGLGA